MNEPEWSPAGKCGLAGKLLSGQSKEVPVICSITASAAGDDLFWWPQQLLISAANAVRRDGAPQSFAQKTFTDLLPGMQEPHSGSDPQDPGFMEAANTSARRSALQVEYARKAARVICFGALNYHRGDWSEITSSEYNVAEAKRRGLTIDECRTAIGMRSVAADSVGQE